MTALTITACASRKQSQRLSEDEILRRKLVGEWETKTPLATSTNQVALGKFIIRSDGSFFSQTSIYDTSGRFLEGLKSGGVYVVTNRAVVLIITTANEHDMLPPLKLPPAPIVRLDDHELVIFGAHGHTVVSRKVSH